MSRPTKRKAPAKALDKASEEEGGGGGEGDIVASYMSVAYTGARVGDVVEGVAPTTKHALLRICERAIAPYQRKLDAVRSDPEAWSTFLQRLGSIAFFAAQTIEQREAWLLATQVQPERMGMDDAATRFQVLGSGSSVMCGASPEDTQRLSDPNVPWSASEIEQMIPRGIHSAPTLDEKPSGRHTLFFIKSWWKVSSDCQYVDSFAGPVIDVAAGTLLPSLAPADAGVARTLIRFERFPVDGDAAGALAFLLPGDASQTLAFEPMRDEHIKPLYASLVVDACTSTQVDVDIAAAWEETHGFSGAGLKSLLQKLIRLRPRYVRLFRSRREIDARLVLLVCAALLACKASSFNPDIGRHVSGLESLTKRLAIIFAEDVSFTPVESSLVLSLMAGAVVAQRVKAWRPARSLMRAWLRHTLVAWAKLACFQFDSDRGLALAPHRIHAGSTRMQVTSALLDQLCSFPCDIGMMRLLAVGTLASHLCAPAVAVPAEHLASYVMPLEHCVDQHWMANVAYFFDPAFLSMHNPPGTRASEPFSELFRKLFLYAAGFNPRRRPRKTIKLGARDSVGDNAAFVAETPRAQAFLLGAKQCAQTERAVLADRAPYHFEYVLDDAWLAGMVGVMELKPHAESAGTVKSPPMLVTLCCDDIATLVAIRKPARSLKAADGVLSDDVEQQAIAEARARLVNTPQPLTATAPPTPLFRGATVRWDAASGTYVILPHNRPGMAWADARRIVCDIGLHAPLESPGVLRGMDTRGEGMEIDAMPRLRDKVLATSCEIMSRILLYLDTRRSEVALRRVARSGGGVEYAVSTLDAEAYLWLLDFACLFPGALRPAPHRLNTFTVPTPPFLWHIVERVREWTKESLPRVLMPLGRDATMSQLRAASTTRVLKPAWDVDALGTTRTLWQHQVDAVADMQLKYAAGRRGWYLHANPGMGKTLIVCEFLKHLAQQKALMPYVVYALPSESMSSVVYELSSFGFQVTWIYVHKSKPPPSRLPAGIKATSGHGGASLWVRGTVHIIEHDDLRQVRDAMALEAANVFFVADEAHKMLAATQRTSAALELASLASGFLALSGTPVIDNKIYALLPYFEKIVPFACSLKNFWVACNSMTSQQMDTGICVTLNSIDVAWASAEQKAAYVALVPASLHGLNTHPSREDLMRATQMCYDACTPAMVARTTTYVRAGFGVLLVARDAAHQTQLCDLVVAGGIARADVFLITKENSIHLTDEAVKKRSVHDFRIVITTQRRCSGYTVTRLQRKVSCVYPSNQATRVQMDGRINRISQAAKHLEYDTLHTGILTFILHNHNEAASINRAITDMATQVSPPPRDAPVAGAPFA